MHGVLATASRSHPDAEALVFDDPLDAGCARRWTYAELEDNARRVAAALLAAGVGKAARVGLLLGNRPEAVATIFGASMAGAVVVPLSTFSTRQELAYLLSHADISVLVTQERLLGRRFADDVAALAPLPRPCPDLPHLRRVVVVGRQPAADRHSAGAESWDELLASGEGVAAAVVDAAAASVAPADGALIIYSSGTTEKPKGILHTQGATALQFWQQAELFGRQGDTRMWTALPVFWTAGFNTAMGSTLAAGGCWVMQETFDPGEALALMERERVTEPYTLPHQTAALEEHPAWVSTDFSSLRCVFGKSAFARHPSVDGDPGWSMPVGYGLSETGAFFSAHGYGASREERRASMGPLLPGNQLKVVDPSTGEALDAGQEGELAVRGPTLMDRYVKRDRRECFDEDGFFHTGDTGFYDEEGFLHFSGRRTEMIKTGGANVSPAELEVALRACPPVKLARAVGVPDALRGEEVVLCVVLKEGAAATEAEIRGFLAERVAAYKVPRRVLFLDDAEMPMTASGTKVRDDALREVLARRLGHRW
ncbi:MAG: class I adenylate-forming enzyme family protein [Acidimicrobiales bacterium]